MEEQLIKLFEENKNNFSFFKDDVDKRTASSIWGMGVTPPFSILPFYNEMLGNKPGKFLKKESKPGKNRQCYFLDTNNRIINCIEYAEFNELNNKWIVFNDFYFYFSDSIVRYAFGSVFEHETNSKLQSVTFAQKEKDKVTKAFTFGSRKEYEELEYLYIEDKIAFIKQKVMLDVYFERNYKIVYNDNISIFEI